MLYCLLYVCNWWYVLFAFSRRLWIRPSRLGLDWSKKFNLFSLFRPCCKNKENICYFQIFWKEFVTFLLFSIMIRVEAGKRLLKKKRKVVIPTKETTTYSKPLILVIILLGCPVLCSNINSLVGAFWFVLPPSFWTGAR